MTQTQTSPLPHHGQTMDRTYRFTRHIYDLSRRYYLLGRDRLLRDMHTKAGDHVLEMGCGTARNLIKFNEQHPGRHLYGLDAASVMLQTAEKSMQKKGCDAKLVCTFAENLDHQKNFGLDEKFDVIFFSYSLSMMPTAEQAIDTALANLKPSGKIYIVDFWDQADIPHLLARGLQTWLKWFGVHFRPELLDHLEWLAKERNLNLHIEPVGPRYAYVACLSEKSTI